MFLRASQLVLSPTDLAAFLTCRHRTGLDLAVARGELAAPDWRDPLGQAFRERGSQHERAYVDWLRRQGLDVLDLSDALDHEREARTLEALHAGVPAVAQAALAADGWRGYADILLRVDVPSALGSWSYEVHDTKLARETRGGTVLQLAVYSDLLGQVQGRRPERFHVVAPGSPFDSAPTAWTTSPPSSAGSAPNCCASCRAGQPRSRRALSRTGRGVRTVPLVSALRRAAADRRPPVVHRRHRPLAPRRADRAGPRHAGRAAAMPLPIAFTPKRGSRHTYVRLREQARVQHRQRTSGTPVHEVLQPWRRASALPACRSPHRATSSWTWRARASPARAGARTYSACGRPGAIARSGPTPTSRSARRSKRHRHRDGGVGRLPACTCITSALRAVRVEAADGPARDPRGRAGPAAARRALRGPAHRRAAGASRRGGELLDQAARAVLRVRAGGAARRRSGAHADGRAGARESGAGGDFRGDAGRGAGLQRGRLPVHGGAARVARGPAGGAGGAGHRGAAAERQAAGRAGRGLGARGSRAGGQCAVARGAPGRRQRSTLRSIRAGCWRTCWTGTGAKTRRSGGSAIA